MKHTIHVDSRRADEAFLAEEPAKQKIQIVHEHRAPTDDSVRLLLEMQTAAEKARIGAFDLPNNVFGGRIEVMRDHATGALRAAVIFDLNGQRFVVKTEIVSDSDRRTVDGVLTDLRDRMAHTIATQMLASLFSATLPNGALK